jgi:hypothetical protein
MNKNLYIYNLEIVAHIIKFRLIILKNTNVAGQVFW